MILILALACGPGNKDRAATEGGPAPQGSVTTIQNKGSDTMVNIAQALAEEYHKLHPEVAIAVSGGGSGTGIAALENGTVDIANSSRDIKPEEAEKIKAATGKEPTAHTIGYDALAIYVHRDNPLQKITKAQLADIYGEAGTTTKWSQLGVKVPGCDSDEIALISRQNNSGTFEYFREWTLGKGDFRLGSRDMPGSKEVVEAVKNTPCAIGYSGMGYKVPEVRWLPVALGEADAGVEPAVATVHDKSYPISRALFMYTPGAEQGASAAYLAWVVSPAGQALVERSGFVPLSGAPAEPASPAAAAPPSPTPPGGAPPPAPATP